MGKLEHWKLEHGEIGTWEIGTWKNCNTGKLVVIL
jgi:hypothetical protein